MIVVCLVLTACNLGQPVPASGYITGPEAWFDAPLPNSTFPIGPVHIMAHGSDPSGVAQFELTANGAATDIPSPDNSNSLVALSYDWTPLQPGTYQLQLRARSVNGEWSPYAETVVVIAEAATPTPTLPPASIELTSLSTETVFYAVPSLAIAALGSPCGDKSVTVRVKAIDPAGIKVVMLFYRLESQAGGDATDFVPAVMAPIGQDLYQVTLTPESLFSSSIVQSYGLSWLQYQAVIQDAAGGTSTRTQVFSDLVLKTCSG